MTSPAKRATRKADPKKVGAGKGRVPRHVAIIMDGNGRWATERKLPRSEGHQAGYENVRRVVAQMGAAGVEYLTLFAFSTENWERPEEDAANVAWARTLLADLRREGSAGLYLNFAGLPEEAAAATRAGHGRAYDRLAELKVQMGAGLTTVFSTRQAVEDYVLDADLVIGAVLVPGAEAPKLITRDMVRAMKRGSVIVDISIDQGGCAETSRPTTHAEPTFIVDDVVHYCVANMPGAVARTSTFALNNATLPFILALADKGPKRAMAENPHLLAGLNVHAGRITYPAVAEALGVEAVPASKAIA